MEFTYKLVDGGRGIWCAGCGKTSYNANDVRELYCGHCKVWHETAEEQADVMARLESPIWTIYDRPADFPDTLVARAYAMGELTPLASEAPITAATLPELRQLVQARSRYLLTRMPRDPQDNACVVESWL